MLGKREETKVRGNSVLTTIKEKITEEQAKETIIEWLSERKIRKNKIDLLDDVVLDMADAMVDGQLVLQDNGLFKYTLIEPLEDEQGNPYILSVELKSRIDYNKGVKPHMHKVKNADTVGQMMAYACGFSGLHMNELGKLDTRDSGFLRNYAAIFF